MSALTLFDLEPSMVRMPSAPEPEGVDWGALDAYALLYTATERGNNSGIRFAMTVDDARAWCSLPESSGVLHGTRWAYFWTTVANFVRCHWGPKEPKIVTAGIVDNGQWDERIAAAGLTKIDVRDFARVFGPLGLDIEAGAR